MNKQTAFKRLAEKLVPIMKAELKKELLQTRLQLNQEEVRVYRKVDRIVKDKRLNETFDYYDVLDGNGLDDIIHRIITHD